MKYIVDAEALNQLLSQNATKDTQINILKIALSKICFADADNDPTIAQKLFDDRIESAYIELNRQQFEVLYTKDAS